MSKTASLRTQRGGNRFPVRERRRRTTGTILIFSAAAALPHLFVYDNRRQQSHTDRSSQEGGAHTADVHASTASALRIERQHLGSSRPEQPGSAEGQVGEGMPARRAHDRNEGGSWSDASSSRPIIYLDGRKIRRVPTACIGTTRRSPACPPNRCPTKGKTTASCSRRIERHGRAGGANGALMSWDASTGRRRSRSSCWTSTNCPVDVQDGSPAVNGCWLLAHWFQEHPLVSTTAAWWLWARTSPERVLSTSHRAVKIKEVGYFVPHALVDVGGLLGHRRALYAIDYSRGLDILRYTGRSSRRFHVRASSVRLARSAG